LRNPAAIMADVDHDSAKMNFKAEEAEDGLSAVQAHFEVNEALSNRIKKMVSLKSLLSFKNIAVEHEFQKILTGSLFS
jgi:hypothetical protein